jgi:hypothetical protein
MATETKVERVTSLEDQLAFVATWQKFGLGEFPRQQKHKAEETEMTHSRSLSTPV